MDAGELFLGPREPLSLRCPSTRANFSFCLMFASFSLSIIILLRKESIFLLQICSSFYFLVFIFLLFLLEIFPPPSFSVLLSSKSIFFLSPIIFILFRLINATTSYHIAFNFLTQVSWRLFVIRNLRIACEQPLASF